MKLRSILAIVLALAVAPALAQVNPGTTPLSIAKGGTAGATASAARTNLGVPTGTSGAVLGFLNTANTWSATQTFPNNSLTLAEFPTIGANTVLGSVAGGTPIALTQAQQTAMMNLATATLQGALPAWPNSTTTFFRGDGTYATLNVAAVGGFGTGVAAALGANIGSAGAPVLFNGAGGAPSSLALGNATGLPLGTGVSGTLLAAQEPAHTGDVTNSAGSLALSIAANAVTNAKMATMTANTVKANATGGSATPTDVTAATARSSSLLNVDSFTPHGDSIYTILATDRTVGTNAAFTASRTWTLPPANAVNPGQEIIVADFQGTVTGVNTLVVTRAGADTINGGTSVTIAAANGGVLLRSDGVSKWTSQAFTAGTGITSLTCGTGLSGGTITTSGTCALALTNATLQANPANPTSATSTTGVMMGLGTTCKLTPVYATRIQVSIIGVVKNTVAGNTSSIKLFFGTSTAPTNGAAITGTQIGNTLPLDEPTASFNSPFPTGGIITGLTPGTAYWFDLSLAASSGTSTVLNLSCSAMEF